MKDQLDPQAVVATTTGLEPQVGTILQVRDAGGGADYQVVVDFGPRLGVRTGCASLGRLHSKQDLVGRRVAALLPESGRGELSLTGFCDEAGAGGAALPSEATAV